MNEILIAAILGVVEGLTEFLPVSSTGHLILAGRLLGFETEQAKVFEVFIQLAAILAVVVSYRKVFINLVLGKTAEGFGDNRGIPLLIITTLPAVVLGLLVHGWIKEHLFNPQSVAAALAVGALWILGAEYFYRHHNPRTLAHLTWKGALSIGLFQCLALWPGMSRSTCTILGGMLCGLDRKSATEYSFFAAVPLMCAATGYDLLKNWDILDASLLPMFATGFVVSFISAWAAVQFLIRFVSRNSLQAFAWYRLVLAGFVFWLM